ncbi:antitoxin [Nocardia paucivorans]|uniref:antitoxin n=1 Tax=Nocardia paucivorans TaxID=114259 RepID=UPI0012FB6365|nr:antitoxin [Nocardia paucivorans]
MRCAPWVFNGPANEVPTLAGRNMDKVDPLIEKVGNYAPQVDEAQDAARKRYATNRNRW